MANPQKEHGYTSIANEILEALARINLSSYQSRIVFLIWRKTYGYNKKNDWIANCQIVEETGIRKSHASRTMKQLIDRKIVTKRGNKIEFNKDYSQWKELPIQATVTNSGLKLPVQGHTKENIQKKASTTTEQKIYETLKIQNPEILPMISDLLEKNPEKDLVAVAMKVAGRYPALPWGEKWLRFINWTATEKDKQVDGKKKPLTKKELYDIYNKI